MLLCHCAIPVIFAGLKPTPFSFANRMHYRLYYALYIFENESLATRSQLASTVTNRTGQQSMDKYRLVQFEGVGSHIGTEFSWKSFILGLWLIHKQ